MANGSSVPCAEAASMAPVPATAATRKTGRGPRRSSTRPATIPTTPVTIKIALNIAPSAASGQCVSARIGWISTPYA